MQAAEKDSNGMSNRREREARSTVADTSDGLKGCRDARGPVKRGE